ncbi:hypothetical protein [uncultured Brevundimonas sp.]|uniref:hypothetical protein n=1 Tax=uncultured Brevundimonas sp. TaxID=213418 RepID=UPI0026185C88|nr:hypothetical protein [uncultured Brevundimonas sp.]
MLVVVPGVLASFALTMGIMIVAENLGTPMDFNQAFNTVIVLIISLIFLPMAQAGAYRWTWHTDRKMADGVSIGDLPDFGSEPTDPPPHVQRPLKRKLYYAALYCLCIGLLIAIYAPLPHREAIARLIDRLSFGRRSAWSLIQIMMGLVPSLLMMAALLVPAERMRKRQGQLASSAQQRLEYQAHTNWLGSLAIAFGMASLLSFVFGMCVRAYL